MSQQPVDKRFQAEPRQAVWAEIRKLRLFTVSQLLREPTVGLDASSVTYYVRSLEAAGYVRCLDAHQPTENQRNRKRLVLRTYELVRDNGIDAPRVRIDGSHLGATAQERMWKVIRILSEFSAAEVAATASTEESPVSLIVAKSYIGHLYKAGYIKMIQPPRFFPSALARYRFLTAKFSGPKPPMVQRDKSIYDPNLKKVVWKKETDHER